MGGSDSGTQSSPLYGKLAAHPGFQSVICLPLTIGRITRGVLVFASENPKEIPEELKVFCQMASEHLALFLENLYLRSRLHEAAQQLHQLQQAAAEKTEQSEELEFDFSTSTQEESA
jgi:transcriptional regulator with GAF, ATPase, and Fis domain